MFGRAWRGANSAVVRNIIYVGAVQIVTLLVPLVTIPWILRALQPVAYGSYAIALAFGQYLVAFVDFGFFLTATQRIARIREDRDQLTRYFWTVQSARIGLAIFGIFFAVIVIIVVPQFRMISVVMAANLPVVLGAILYPQWLFFGLERVKAVSLSNIASRILSALPVFFCVNSPDDVTVAVLLSAANPVIAGLISTWLIVRWKLVGSFVWPGRLRIIQACRDAWPLFVASIGVTLYAGSNTIILGLTRDRFQVGIFNAADKVRSVAMIPVSAITQVYYPRVSRLMANSRSEGANLIVNITLVVGALMACISCGLFWGASEIVDLLMGNEYADSIPVLKVLAIVPFMVGINTVLAQMAMLNLGMQKECARIIVFAGLVNVLMLIILTERYGALGAGVSLAITEVLVTLLMAVTLYRNGFLPGAIKAAVAMLRQQGKERT